MIPIDAKYIRVDWNAFRDLGSFESMGRGFFGGTLSAIIGSDFGIDKSIIKRIVKSDIYEVK
jgi:hypothetical protein